MLTKQTLDTIQSGPVEEVYRVVTDAALYMATGGFLEQGNQLLSELWKYKLPHDRNTWLPDIAFMVLWNAAGVRPEFIPFEWQDIDSIERNMRGYIAMDKWAYKMPDTPWSELSGQDLLRKAYITARMVKGNGEPPLSLNAIMATSAGEKPDNGTSYLDKIGKYAASLSVQQADHFPSAEAELEALNMLEKLAAENFMSDEGLALGAELAARHGEIDKAIGLIKIWGRGYQNQFTHFRLPLLASGRYIAPLLLGKVIADELKLSDSIVNSFLVQATTTLDTRLVHGRSLAYGHYDWRRIIEEISRASIVSDPELFEEEVIDSGWIGFQGASSGDIAETENRLGLLLPEDYKSFLQISDGIRGFPHCNPALLSVSKIDYIKKFVAPDEFQGLCNFPTDENDPELFESYLSRAIMISEYPGEQMIWLIAPRGEDDAWQAWFFAYWLPGDRRYPAFRYFMEDQLMSITKSINQL